MGIKISQWRLEMQDLVSNTLGKVTAASEKVSGNMSAAQAKTNGLAAAQAKMAGTAQRGNNAILVSAREVMEAQNKRKLLIRQEIQDLRELQARSKAAFTVRDITSYNQRIAETKQRIQALNGTAGGLNNLSNSFKGMLASAGIFLSLRAGFDFLTGSAKAYDIQSKADAQLRAGLISTKSVAGQTFEQLKKQASDLQGITLFGDEQTQGAQALLLTFTNVRNSIYSRTIPAIQDMATRLAGDGPVNLKGASILLGKALHDPVSNLSELAHAGVKFSDQQKAVIGALVKTNQLAKAQEIILGQVEEKFGGSAVAAKAGLGGWQSLGIAFGDLREQIGGLLVDGTGGLVPFLEDTVMLLSQSLGWMRENSHVVKALAFGVGAAATAYGLYRTGLMISTAWTKIMTIQTWSLTAAFAANPIGWVVGLIGALTAGIVYAWGEFEGFRGFLYGLWDSIKTIFSGITDIFADVFGGIHDLIMGVISFDPELIGSGLKKIGKGIIASNPVVFAMQRGEEIADSFNKGFDKGVADFRQDKAKEKATGNDAFAGINPADLIDPKDPGADITAGLSGVNGGGGGVKNIRVEIRSLVENMYVEGDEVQGDGQDFVSKMTEFLVRAVAGAEVAISR